MFKKICNILSSVILVVMAAVAGILLIPYLFGCQTLTVLSGSMEPAYHVGSVVFVQKVKPEEVKVGDAITFQLGNGMVATHRVTSIDTNKRQFVTKGDANNTEDGPTDFDKFVGRASNISIPYLGYVAVDIKTPKGIMAATGLIVVIVLLAFLPDIFTKEKEPAQENVTQESADSKI
ncbi:MAG TPA: signal peptidase I [Caproiciproducens sp.]|nr:signal peptidase I [Caproiciproducens sp.]